MELSQLKMFKLVAEQGSIIRASAMLHCVLSNITNRLKHLEGELGVSLFIRKGRGLVISPSGTVFLDYANKILALCQEARWALEPGGAPSGTLRIGAIESSAIGRLPTLLAGYHEEHPQVTLQFSTGTWPNLVNEVVSHNLDGAIIAVAADHPDIACAAIYAEELLVVASAVTAAVNGPEDLRHMNIFMWPPGCPYRGALEKWLVDHRVSTSIVSIASYATILGCVSSGAGVSLVPRGIFEQFNAMGNLRAYRFGELAPIQNYFVWNRHVESHPAKEKFAELLKASFSRT